jgi:large subunit ribosomal protein L25
VPIHIVGEDVAPGVKGGGLVSHDLTDVEVECYPKDLPEYIEVDISSLEVGDAIHLSGLKVPDGVTLTELERGEDHDISVVSIHAKRIVEEEEEGVETPAAEGGEAGEAATDEAEDES